MNFSLKGLIAALLGAALVLGGVTLAYVWIACRVYVPPDKCLVLIRKTGDPLPPGEKIAGAGQKGIQRDTLGPGRYFFNPFAWDWELRDLVKIDAGDPQSWREHYAEGGSDIGLPEMMGSWPQVGILVNKVGKAGPAGQEVVDEGFQGIQKHVLTPGTYRINPHVYEVRTMPATVVPLGCCGVVTSQLGEMPGTEVIQETSIGPDGQPIKGHAKVIQKLAQPGQRGVLANVLQPGIYYLNPYVHRVQIVQVGYNQISQLARRVRTAKGNEIMNDSLSQNISVQQAAAMDPQEISTHIQFPSKDGFNIEVEVTVVWGRHPDHIAEMINRLGDIQKIKEIILGQMRSICRNLGSDFESTDFIRGEQREVYQHQVTETLRRVCRERDIEILIALIHDIEVRAAVPIGTIPPKGDMAVDAPQKGGKQPAKQVNRPQQAVQKNQQQTIEDQDLQQQPSPDFSGRRMVSAGEAIEGVPDLKTTIQRGFIAREQDLTKQAQRETAKHRADLEAARVAVDVAREKISAETRKSVAEILAEGQKLSQEIDAQRDLEVATIEREIATLDAETTRRLGKANAQVDQLRNQAQADGKRMMVEAFGNGRAYNLYTFAQSFSPESIRLIFAGEGTFWTDLTKLQDAAALELLKDSGGGPP